MRRRPEQFGATILSDVDILTFDATIQESHASEWEVTRHPVEEGAEPADHVRERPQTFTLMATVTITPTNEDLQEHDRDRKLRDRLLAIAAARRPVDVVTWVGVLEGYIITRVSTPVSSEDSGSLTMDVAFEHLRIVEAETVGVPEEYLAEEVEAAAAPQKTASEGNAEETDELTQQEVLARAAESADDREGFGIRTANDAERQRLFDNAVAKNQQDYLNALMPFTQ